MTRFLLPLLALLLFIPGVHAAELSAREIMQKVKDRDSGKTISMDIDMILVDAKGNQRQRQLRSYTREAPDNPDDSQSIMFFLAPANVKDTGFLTYDYDAADQDDDQWLYLPALKKVKRIAAADKSGSFMGSDFTYADMSSPSLDDYTYELMKVVEIDGHKAWQIKATPATEAEVVRTGYTQSVLFVRQDNFIPVRSVNWVKNGNKLKYMEIKKLERIDGIWTPLEMVMSTKSGRVTEHASVLRMSQVKYNEPLSDELFTQRQLSRGP